MAKYKHLFFDWDHTIWDFKTNSERSLEHLFNDLEIQSTGIPCFDTFYSSYHRINDLLWARYRHGHMDKATLREERFNRVFEEFEIEAPALAAQLEDRYVRETPLRNILMPGAKETLETLKDRGYKMHVITNGFSESQLVKFEHSGIQDLFDLLLCSDTVGVNKPHPKIFRHAMKQVGAKRKHSLMIGDSIVADCLGAQAEGIDSVYFNPHEIGHTSKVAYEIKAIPELLHILP